MTLLASSDWKRMCETAAHDAKQYRKWAAEARAEGKLRRTAEYEHYAATREGDALLYEREYFAEMDREAKHIAEVRALVSEAA